MLGWWAAGAERARPAAARTGAPTADWLRERAAARRAAAREVPVGWVEPALEWNRRRGASTEFLARARDVLSGGGTVVVTGQQPGIFGGPLYTLYKLLTAVELAAAVERESGRPCLAVFWIVGDDSDFGEVSGTWWPRPDGSVVRLRDPATPAGGALVGLLPAVERQAPLLADASLFAQGDRGAGRKGRLEAALESGGTWSGALVALIHLLLPGLPVLFLDGADPAVIAAQTPWLAQAATWPLPALLAQGAGEAAAAGYPPALDPSLGERAVFRLAGGRREALSGFPAAGDLLAPNVTLRPLVQDLLLPNVATVCGPSELRYRAQLGPLYRHAGLAEPLLCPRARAVLVAATGIDPAGLAEDDWRALREPDAWLDRLASRALPEPLRARSEALRKRLRQDLDLLAADLLAYDAGLGQLLESVRGKADFQLGRLEEGLAAKARQKLCRRHPRLLRWREFVRPRETDQERSLSLLAPWLLEDRPRLEPLREAARTHLRRWAEGDPEAAAVLELESPPEEVSA